MNRLAADLLRNLQAQPHSLDVDLRAREDARVPALEGRCVRQVMRRLDRFDSCVLLRRALGEAADRSEVPGMVGEVHHTPEIESPPTNAERRAGGDAGRRL